MGTDRRARWLGHPAFLASVAVLAVNDHVLKAAHPGWWTGKLSDVAGLAVVAVVAGVLVGPARGAAVTAVGFVVLKAVPGGAELAAPVLGGVTRRDLTDLLALAVLPPVWWLLERSEHGPAAQREDAASWRSGWARCRAAASAAAPVVGLLVAAGATTATSCDRGDAVISVTEEDGHLYAAVDGVGYPPWARSTDGGRTWEKLAPPSVQSALTTTMPYEVEENPTGPQVACTAGRTCWRLVDERAIERVEGGVAVEEARLTDEEYADIYSGCGEDHTGVLSSIAAADGPDGPHVVASLGADGVLARQQDGTWDRVGVLGVPPAQPNVVERNAKSLLVVFGPALAIVIWLVGMRHWPSPGWGIAVALLGWVATLALAGLAGAFGSMSLDRGEDATRYLGRVAVAGMLFTTLLSVLVASHKPRPQVFAYPAGRTSTPLPALESLPPPAPPAMPPTAGPTPPTYPPGPPGSPRPPEPPG